MVGFRIKFTRQALKDLELVKASSLNNKAKNLINIIKQTPYQTPPPRIIKTRYFWERISKLLVIS